MKILFVPSGCLPFHANTLAERPLGGMETAVIRLAEALSALGHRVIVLSGLPNPAVAEPLYLPIAAYGDVGPVDALIAVREWKPLLLPIEAKVKMLWTGDSYDQPQNVGIGDHRVAARMDYLLAVSDWHAQRLSEESGFPFEKTDVLRNGVHLADFSGSENRHPKRLIYSSTPYRGLVHLPELYLEIRKKHPDAELHIYSGYKVYAASSQYDRSALQQYAQLVEVLKRLPGCTVHGNVRQSELARAFMSSAVLAYPNTFEETSCITAMEAQAAGCVVVTTSRGALPETVGEAGMLIEGSPGTADYSAAFCSAIDRLFSEPEFFTQLSEAGRSRAVQFDWHNIARRFCAFLDRALSQ
ncbi:MAG: glycosyltransferase family 4 protein [Bdellovibrionales bacterium]|nr:glycosyltransferase family 4 protein [Bdellovibrionales bacterium]